MELISNLSLKMAYDFKDLSVLIVEDNQPMSDLVQSLLHTLGIKRIYVSRNGEEGFKSYIANKPDIIIADWVMKPVDGITFTQRIRKNKNSPNRYVPILLMTGFSEKKRVLTARDAGVTEFLVKPFTAQDLYKRLTQIIERPRQFVKTEKFFGPDRRRQLDVGFEGEDRRQNPKNS
jgi:two-component system chemotaxis response regulator CheY